MTECQFNITAEERDLLVEVLEDVLREIRVEEHRTRAPGYRECILRREDLIGDMIHRLGHTTSSTAAEAASP